MKSKQHDQNTSVYLSKPLLDHLTNLGVRAFREETLISVRLDDQQKMHAEFRRPFVTAAHQTFLAFQENPTPQTLTAFKNTIDECINRDHRHFKAIQTEVNNILQKDNRRKKG